MVVNSTRRVRILQVLGILVMVVIVVVIASKGISDIGALARDAPDDFWRALARYLLDNLAAGARNWRPPPPGSMAGCGL